MTAAFDVMRARKLEMFLFSSFMFVVVIKVAYNSWIFFIIHLLDYLYTFRFYLFFHHFLATLASKFLIQGRKLNTVSLYFFFC